MVVIVCRQRKRTELDNSSRPAKLRLMCRGCTNVYVCVGGGGGRTFQRIIGKH